jgi:hypothetical protein
MRQEVEAMMVQRRAQLLLLLLLVLRPVPHFQHLARWPRASLHRVSLL